MMRKNIFLYLLAFGLLGIVLIFFNRVYSELSTYTELTNRHNRVHSYYLNLSKQINNAAILDPDLIKVNSSAKSGKLFFTDSLTVIRQLDLLQSSVRDSVNIGITEKLNDIIRSELSWLLRNNLPDSFKLNKSSQHVLLFKKADSLIDAGIQRTIFLIDFRKEQLDDKINELKLWMSLFISLSFLLLVYTTANLFKQRSKLKIKEFELGTVLDRIRDGVISLDREWRYTFLNDAAMATHPLGKKETIGKLIWDVHPQIKGTIFWAKYQEAIETKKVLEIESYYEPMGFWFSVIIYPSGSGLTIFYKDVTESKKAEQKLSQTRKEVADYKFALDEASIVSLTDQKGIIQYVNNNFCNISKYSREELIGRDHRIINSGYHSAAYIRNLWVTIAHGDIWKGELKNKAKDGTNYWVDTTIVPFLNESGKPYQYIAIRSDVTERKQAEEKLEKSEKIYKTIASSIPGSVIYLLDKDYRFLLIEGDMLEKLGYSKDQLLGQKARDVLNPERFADVEDQFKRALNGETVTAETSRLGYQMISRFIPLKDENNNVYIIMVVAMDITELKKAHNDIYNLNRGLEEKIIKRTDQLKKSNDDMEAFSYSVSHDLRSPLRGIIGFSSILEEDYAGRLDSEGRRIISIIKKNTLKMGILIDDLLSFSRMGKQALLKVTVDTNALISEVVAELMQSNPGHKIINWQIHVLPEVSADIKTYRQVWINLISNAIKYSSVKDKPVIEIGSYENENQHVFFVKDNGVGFNEEYENKLFKVFQRLHNADEFEGTGVGLAIVEKIITRHAGKVWAEGKEDLGACFYFSLPK
jgi:PAS domain S-box-containing protein